MKRLWPQWLTTAAWIAATVSVAAGGRVFGWELISWGAFTVFWCWRSRNHV